MIRHTLDQLSESTKAFLNHSTNEDVSDCNCNKHPLSEINYNVGSLGTQRFLMEDEGDEGDEDPSDIDIQRHKALKRLLDDVLREADRKAFCLANPNDDRCQDDYEEPEDDPFEKYLRRDDPNGPITFPKEGEEIPSEPLDPWWAPYVDTDKHPGGFGIIPGEEGGHGPGLRYRIPF
jgi:hypothetical protein